MSVAPTGKNSKKKAAEPRTNWKRVQSLKAAQIRTGISRDPEAMATDEDFWNKAEVVLPRSKKIVTMRLDARPSRLASHSAWLLDAD